jgi:hypothetical protein
VRSVGFRISCPRKGGVEDRFEKAEQVDRQNLLVGEVRVVIVALPLDRSCEPTSVLPNNEQVDSNERILGVHVAKGGLLERCWSILFKPPAATWFFKP